MNTFSESQEPLLLFLVCLLISSGKSCLLQGINYSVDLLDLLVPFGGSCVEPDGSSLADGEADTHTETETPGVPSVPAGRPASFSL